ncbi:NAD(P)H-dependent flavin oxidoreductase [Sphingosinicella terrae]|uniref:NAD(P)H-dependent flavin oxidoreductase n=1 Tax=Sphingosinicella terrae TaxID=2172047 RepID=UPI000E0D4D01|nr:nitronate monooxygenase [Sphingosinicella terrae]
MSNKICEMLRIEFPLFAFSHCRDVVAAVSKAGGFGVFGGAMIGPDQLKIELDWIDAHVDGKPYGVDLAIPENMADRDQSQQSSRQLYDKIPQAHKDFVDGLLTRHGVNPKTPVPADEDHDISHFLDTAEAMVDEALRHPIRLFVNALGVPPQFMIDKSHAAGVPVGALVGSKEHALRQLALGVDVLVAQGTEAAAHCGEVSTMVLVPEVVAAVRDAGSDVPVLAAGGIVTGRQMAAAMTMGAAGAWTGSVWLPTVESGVSEAVKRRLLAARSRDTLRSRAMTGKTARQLRSAWNEAWEGADSPGPLPMPFQHLLTDRAFQQIEKSVAGGNEGAMPLVTEGVGQGIGMISSEKSCRTVVQEFMEDFADAVENMKVWTA